MQQGVAETLTSRDVIKLAVRPWSYARVWFVEHLHL